MIGRFATSKAGHDKGTLYVIVGVEGDYVYLSDGNHKTLSNPKKKRVKHIQSINRIVEEELLTKLQNRQKVLDEEIKFAIKHYE